MPIAYLWRTPVTVVLRSCADEPVIHVAISLSSAAIYRYLAFCPSIDDLLDRIRRVLVWTRRFAFMNYWGFSALLSAPWVWWMYLSGLGGLQRLRGLLALLLRLTMVGLFAIALSDPRSVRESDKLSVVYALDVSDSIGTESIDQALDFVLGTTEKKSAKDEAGLVVFARGAAH